MIGEHFKLTHTEIFRNYRYQLESYYDDADEDEQVTGTAQKTGKSRKKKKRNGHSESEDEDDPNGGVYMPFNFEGKKFGKTQRMVTNDQSESEHELV